MALPISRITPPTNTARSILKRPVKPKLQPQRPTNSTNSHPPKTSRLGLSTLSKPKTSTVATALFAVPPRASRRLTQTAQPTPALSAQQRLQRAWSMTSTSPTPAPIKLPARYAAGNARPMDLTITPESGAAKTYSKLLNNTTGGWVEANQIWQLETQTIELTAGKNTLRLQTSANGGHNLPSLDAMTITKSDLDTCNEQGVIKKDSLRGSSCNPSETLWSTGHNLCITFYEHGGFGEAALPIL